MQFFATNNTIMWATQSKATQLNYKISVTEYRYTIVAQNQNKNVILGKVRLKMSFMVKLG